MSAALEGGCACGAVRYRVTLPDGVPAFAAYYELEKLWPATSLERARTLAG